MSKGKLIVLEGLDGSGKATQAKLLAAHLKEQGFSVREITFPNYESDSSALVKMYLSGQFGQHPDANTLSYYAYDGQKLEHLLYNPKMIRTPIVRNGRQATVGYCPDVWKDWE